MRPSLAWNAGLRRQAGRGGEGHRAWPGLQRGVRRGGTAANGRTATRRTSLPPGRPSHPENTRCCADRGGHLHAGPDRRARRLLASSLRGAGHGTTVVQTARGNGQKQPSEGLHVRVMAWPSICVGLVFKANTET